MKPLFCVLALLPLAACTQATTPATQAVDNTEAELKAVLAAAKTAEQAWTAKDLNGIMAQYAPNATLVVSNAPPAKGPDAIRGMLAELLKDPAASVSMQVANTEISGGLAYQHGNYTLHVTDPKSKKVITETGSSLMVYKKQADGSWKVVEDFNVAAPAAQ